MKKEQNNPIIPPINEKNKYYEFSIEMDPKYKEDRIFDAEVKSELEEAYKRFAEGENVVSIKNWRETAPYNVSSNEIRKYLNKYDFPDFIFV